MNNDHIGIIEAATILGVRTATVYYYLNNRMLPPIDRFGRSYVLSRKAVEEFAERRNKREVRNP
jgi:excisionase family DNA binding protein